MANLFYMVGYVILWLLLEYFNAKTYFTFFVGTTYALIFLKVEKYLDKQYEHNA